MGKFSEDIIKLFEEFKKESSKYENLRLEDVEFEYKKLKDVATTIKAGGTPRTDIADYWADDTSLVDNENYFGWRDIDKNLFSNMYIEDFSKVITKEGLENSSTWLVPENSILLAIASNSKGLLAINKVPMCINQNILGIVLDHTQYDVRYIYFCLKNIYSRILNKGYGNLTKSSEENREVPIPKPIKDEKGKEIYSSYEIQKVIADFIEFIALRSDDVIKIMNEIKEKAEKGKKVLIYKLFDVLPRLKNSDREQKLKDVIQLFEEFKKEIGNYQDLRLEKVEFEEKSLNDICERRTGFTPKTDPNGDIYFFKVGDLSKVEGIEINEPNTEEMTNETFIREALGENSSKLKPIQKGDILVSFKLTVGIAKIYNSEKIAYCNEAIDILTVKEGYYNKYLVYIVGEKYKQASVNASIRGKSLNKDVKAKITIPIPKPIKDEKGNEIYSSYDIQKAIAEFIEFAFDSYLEDINKIKGLSDKIEKAILLKLFNSTKEVSDGR